MIEAAAFAALDARLDSTSRDPLAVAVSGGGDSMALLHLTAEWARRCTRPVRVLTVDHGLNPDNAVWAVFVADSARRLGLSTEVLRWRGAKPSSGLPAAARAARHALLAQAAREVGARVLLMGHTADDVLEARRMRADGASVGDPRGWAPSPAWPEGRGVFLLRPLLALRREPLRAWLRARGQAWIEDPANADMRFHRARVRDPRLPLEASPDGTHDGGRPAVRADADLANRPPPAPAASRDGILRLTRAEAPGWLGPALLSASGQGRPPTAASLHRLCDRIASGETFTATLAGARLEADGDTLLIGREAGRSGLPTRVAAEAGTIWDGRFAIETGPACAIVPLSGRLAQLPPEDRAVLAQVPSWQRPTLPGLETAGGLRLAPRRCLVGERFRAACGAFAREGELPSGYRGATPAEVLSVSGIQ